MKFLTTVLFVVLFSFCAFAGIGGSSGGVSNAKRITAEVCDDSGQNCHIIQYKARPQSNFEPEEVQCAFGEAGYGPCPTNYGVPVWLRKFNERVNQPGEKPGPHNQNHYGN